MKLNIYDKLIQEFESPKGLLYRMVVIYSCFMVFTIFSLSLILGNVSRLNFYFLINLFTVAVMVWFIRRSFNIHSRETHLLIFRVSLFFLLNSSLLSMAGGLNLVDREVSSVLAAILYVPGLMMIIYSFDKFIAYVNVHYKSAIGLSLTDELTGLPNRRHLNIILREIENKAVTICIADVDHFKKINDTYGHEVGDEVLAHVGLRFKDFISETVFIARSGGEEFVIVFYDTGKSAQAAEIIKNSLSLKHNESVSMTMSMGVANKQKDESSAAAMTAADRALYQAKQAGRDCIRYALRDGSQT